MATFSSYAINIPTNGKRVIKIEITLALYNVVGTVYYTDVMFQGGTLATLWTGSPAELEWAFNA